MKYLYTMFWRQGVSRIINQMLFCWLKLGRKVDRKRLRIHSNIVGCFCFAENRGMLPSIELLNELDVIVIVINRRLLYLWRTSVFIVIFPFCGGIKRISALTYDYFSSVVVLLLCIRPIDHAGGLCMSPILLYRENWVRIVLFLYRNRLMLCLWVSS